MRLYVWQECLKTGAYHEDGSAFVIAETLKQARNLVPKQHDYYSYHSAVLTTKPTKTIPIVGAKAQVVALESGCDC